jgi:hypothetical protein
VATKTSKELKAELTNLFFGINGKTLAVETVTVTRGGTIALQQASKPPKVYRIRDGRPAYGEVQRVFGLTNLVAMSPASDLAQILTHPLLVELRQVAEAMRIRRADLAGAAPDTGDKDG